MDSILSNRFLKYITDVSLDPQKSVTRELEVNASYGLIGSSMSNIIDLTKNHSCDEQSEFIRCRDYCCNPKNNMEPLLTFKYDSRNKDNYPIFSVENGKISKQPLPSPQNYYFKDVKNTIATTNVAIVFLTSLK